MKLDLRRVLMLQSLSLPTIFITYCRFEGELMVHKVKRWGARKKSEALGEAFCLM
jgi:hypothetical protein